MYQTIFVRLCQRGVFSRLYTVKSVVFFSHVCCSSLHFDRIFLFGCFYYVAGSDSAMVTVHALWLFGFIMDGEDVKGNVFKPITPNTKCLFLASKVRLLAFFCDFYLFLNLLWFYTLLKRVILCMRRMKSWSSDSIYAKKTQILRYMVNTHASICHSRQMASKLCVVWKITGVLVLSEPLRALNRCVQCTCIYTVRI